MKTKFTATCILVGSLLSPMMMAHADSDASGVHPVDFIKDSAITTAVKTKLAAEHLKSLTHINVDTDRNGVVWLSGHASSQYQVDKAESLARDTNGVKMVKNNIEVRAD
jgi:hyperosmotically inducible protein